MLEIIDTANYGGAEKHTRLITKTYANMGFDVWFIYPPGEYAETYKSLEKENVTCIEYDIRRNLFQTIKYVKELLIQNDIWFIHSHNYLADFIAASASKRMTHIKCFTTIHFLLKLHKTSPIKKLQMYLFSLYAFSKMKKVYTVSNEVARITSSYFHQPKGKVMRALNSIDFGELVIDDDKSLALRRELDPYGDKIIVLCTSILHEAKGQKTIIEAIGKYLKDLPIVFWMLGRGEEKENYEKFAQELQCEDKIKFAGYRNDVNIWFQVCDIYVHPSHHDPLPRSLLEAMYFKNPIVASSIDSIKEVMSDRENGLLADPNNPHAWALAIRSLLDDNDLSCRIAKNAHSFIQENCSMDKMAQFMIDNLDG